MECQPCYPSVMRLLGLPKIFFDFIADIYKNRFVIFELTKRDYKNRYIGSTLGFAWTIIQPLAMMLILWLVFVKGFGSAPIRGTIPFIAWFATGFIAWNFFSEALAATTNVFQEYSYLIKKMNFRIAILPIVKLLSSFISHLIFLFIGIIIVLACGLGFSFWWFQSIYYLLCMSIFLLGLSWIFASLQVFSKDVSQIVSIILQFGFWITPVVWKFDMVPKQYQIYFLFNPMFYIVDGYRRSFIFHEPFWERWQMTIYFWLITSAILLLGIFLFKKLRPHFADVL